MAAMRPGWGLAASGLICAIGQTSVAARWRPSLLEADCAAIERALPSAVRGVAGRALRLAVSRPSG